MNIFKKIIEKLFDNELKNSEKLQHDPFKGHIVDSRNEGKSYFNSDISLSYYGFQDGICNAGDSEICDVKPIEVSRKESENVKIFTFRLQPTKMVEECLSTWAYREPTDEELQKPVIVGYEVKTRKTDNLRVKKIHGCLQLCSSSVIKYDEVETDLFTVIVTKEEIGWCVATVFPGSPSEGHIGDFLKTVRHYDEDGDPEDPTIIVGYKDGDDFYESDLVENAPKWIYDHIVKI